MPLERPRRRSVVGPDGLTDPAWTRYFDSLDTDQSVTVSFETETRFQGTGETVDPAVRQTRARVVATETRLTALETSLREIDFLGSEH